MKVVAALSALVLFLLAPPAVSQAPDDKLIVPGQRIGKWTLDMTIDSLLQLNGRPNVASPIRTDHISAIWAYSWNFQGESGSLVAATFDRRSIVYLAANTAESFKTDKGVGPGASRQAVIAAYGQPTGVTDVPDFGAQRLIFDQVGLAFWFLTITPGQPAVIVNAAVYRAGTAKNIWKF